MGEDERERRGICGSCWKPVRKCICEAPNGISFKELREKLLDTPEAKREFEDMTGRGRGRITPVSSEPGRKGVKFIAVDVTKVGSLIKKIFRRRKK